jgi:hypothetical protein
VLLKKAKPSTQNLPVPLTHPGEIIVSPLGLSPSLQIESRKPQEGLWNLYRDGITCSMLTDWMMCPEKARLKYIEGLYPVKDSSEAMDFGTMLHDCREGVCSLYMRLNTAYERKQFVEDIDHWCEVVTNQYWDIKFEEMNIVGDDWGNLDLVHSLVREMLPRYFKHYESDWTKINWKCLERVFDVTIMVRGVPIRLRGKIDGEFEEKGIKLFEMKSKGRINEEAIADKLSIDLQVGIYLYAMWKKWNTHPNGVLYDIVRKPGTRRKTDEKTQVYAERCAVEIDKDPAHYFIRIPADVFPSDITGFETELIGILECVMDWFNGHYHYKNTTACMAYGKPCDFLLLCGRGNMSYYKKGRQLMRELQALPIRA